MRKRPYPGDVLVKRVTGVSDRDLFFSSGRQSVDELKRVVALTGRTLESFRSVLDFGCGCGRMLLWLDAKRVRLHGCDVDTEAVEWVRKNLPYVDAVANSADPPLPYADESFDLIYNHSVFTHIDAARQDAWLAELARVACPGAVIVLTVHGDVAFRVHERHRLGAGQDPAPERERLEREGILFFPEGQQEGFPDWYATTYHTAEYVLEHWSRWLTVQAYVHGGALGFQDMVLLSNGRPSSWES